MKELAALLSLSPMADRVADAMAEKHWSDVLGEPFRGLGLSSPPVMLRLVPDDAAERS